MQSEEKMKTLVAILTLATLVVAENASANPFKMFREVCNKGWGGQVTCFVVIEEGYNYGRDRAIDLYNNPPQFQAPQFPQGQMEYYGDGHANSTPYYFNQNPGGDCNQFLHNC